MKQWRWEAPGKRREEARRSEKRKVRRKKIQAHEKIEKSRNTVFFQCVNVMWLWRFEKKAR
jgi:hypothetical protein